MHYRSLAAVVLVLACSLPTQIQAARPPLHLVYVEPPGAVWSLQERADARQGIEAALAFWQALAPTPAPAPLFIIDERTITGTVDDVLPRPSEAGLTIFVIDSTAPLLGNYWALAAPGVIWALRGDGDHFAATIAHELGHAVYGLPHAYGDIDIMALDPMPAYAAHTIGCTTLARLGRPCTHLWLPVVNA